MSKGSASRLTEVSPALSRSSTRRRVGSASARVPAVPAGAGREALIGAPPGRITRGVRAMADDPAGLRRNYDRARLLEGEADPDPVVQFARWFEEAAASGEVYEPNAVALATVGADGRPSARTVLLKGFDERGFAFYTNLESRKAAELAANPHAALLFYWGR